MIVLFFVLVLLGIASIPLYTYFLFLSLQKEYQELTQDLNKGKTLVYQERIKRYNQKVDVYNKMLWRLSILKMDRFFQPLPYIFPDNRNQIHSNKT